MRTTAGAVLVVGAALLAGSIALVTLLAAALTRDAGAAALVRAEEVAAALDSTTGPRTLAVADDEDHVVQVLDGQGRVLASSANAAGRPPVARPPLGGTVEVDAPLGAPGEFVAAAASTPTGGYTVIVARSLEDVADTTRAATRLLLVGLPILLLVVAGTTWIVVGRALAPVEELRTEVDEISGTQLHRRVHEGHGDDEIARLASTMNRMLGRLQDSQTRQRRFTSDASHELRSPVAGIRQHAEVALAHPELSTTAELAATVLAETLRIQHLVDGLLLLARADEGTLPGRDGLVDLDDLLFAHARRVRSATGIEVDSTAVSAGRVRGVRTQLDTMISNVSDNATRHARSRITLSLTEIHADGLVLLRVDDDGTGIPQSERQRVFERFVRLDDARSRDSGGAGLGLAIVAEVTAAHHGTVTITDAPTGGARVEVRLPLAADP